jgi:ankyrin repeat protein
LFWGVDVGNRAVVQLLLDEGADPNGFVEEKNPYGTALHVAILKNRWMEVKMLVDASADVTRQTDCLVSTNAQDRVNSINKTTPMELASLLGRQVTLDKVLLSGHTGSDAREKFKTKVQTASETALSQAKESASDMITSLECLAYAFVNVVVILASVLRATSGERVAKLKVKNDVVQDERGHEVGKLP